jgi:hypothetical protein
MKEWGLLVIAVTLMLVGCSPSIEHTTLLEQKRLHRYNPIFFKTIDSNQTKAQQKTVFKFIDPNKEAKIFHSSDMFASDIAEQTAASFKFELELLGFSLSRIEKGAKAIVEFYLGPVTYDLFGWSSDLVIVRFTEARSGKTIITYRVKEESKFSTPEKLIHHLTTAIMEDY